MFERRSLFIYSLFVTFYVPVQALSSQLIPIRLSANNLQAATNPTSYEDGDTLKKFSHDINTVIKDMYASEDDLTIPALFRNCKPSFTHIWTNADWETHTSRRRYARIIMSMPASRLVRRILPTMIVLSVWSAFSIAMISRSALVKILQIDLTPLSLISTFVAALLTMRSNQGLSRLSEARSAFGEVVLQSRELAQLIATSIVPNEKQMGLLAGKVDILISVHVCVGHKLKSRAISRPLLSPF
jgi:hypothetical protein